MSVHTPTPSVAAAYVHRDKLITPGAPLTFAGVRFKWYDVAPRELPVDVAVADLARAHLLSEGDAFQLKGDLGFVVLHRCGAEFYFLIVNTWANENEIWELVLAKENAHASDFAVFPRSGPQLPTYCVWELGCVLHEQQAWRRYLYSSRDETAKRTYLGDQVEGAV